MPMLPLLACVLLAVPQSERTSPDKDRSPTAAPQGETISPAKDLSSPEVRVVTFNVRYGTARDGANRWEARRDLVVEVLRNAAADVIGVQEALDFQLRELAAALPGYQVLGQGREGGTEGEHAALLVARERLQVVEHGDFWLCETPERVGAKGWDAALPRICTWAVLEVVPPAPTAAGAGAGAGDAPAHGPRFAVLNTHFDHVGARARAESARLLVERANAWRDLPCLVLGDLNSTEDSPPLATLAAARFVDAWRTAHPQATAAGTFHAFRGADSGPRIDYVLCRGAWAVLEATIDRFARDGRFPSDHFPVRARLRLGAGTAAGARDEPPPPPATLPGR